MVVPDYYGYLKPFIDKNIERYAKEEWTKLQFIFEKADVSINFPTGVRVESRAYAQDSVVQIWKKTDLDLKNDDHALGAKLSGMSSLTEFVPVRLHVHPDPPEGMSILKATPRGTLKPDSFQQGSQAKLEATVAQVKNLSSTSLT